MSEHAVEPVSAANGERGSILAFSAPEDALLRTDSELEAVRAVLQGARAGDLIPLTVHSDRGAVLELVSGLGRRGWAPGDALD